VSRRSPRRAPGWSTDSFARAIAPSLTKTFGQTFVDNQAGTGVLPTVQRGPTSMFADCGRSPRLSAERNDIKVEQ
jgi:hypothetical protein